MAKPKLDQNLQEILSVLNLTDKALSARQISEQLQHAVSGRTLLRRLTQLIELGEVISRGKKKGTVYLKSDYSNLLSLSEQSVQLKAKVRRPVQQRQPVSYNRDFLYRYKPNVDFYLAEQTRQHLQSIGQQFKQTLEVGTYVKRILHRLLVDLAWNSSRLEGNTYSLLETERLLDFGAQAQGKNILEARMILNHKNAIEHMVESIDFLGFNKQSILNLHAFLSDGLLANPQARGQLRKIPVGIGKTVYHPPEIPQLIDECFQHILNVAETIQDPFEQSFFVIVHLPYLQPFEDVNKRVSRLAANIPFMRKNLSPLSFIDVPKDDYICGLLGVYELNDISLMRDVFVWAYERSAAQYQLVYNTIGQPNTIEMRYKKYLIELIKLIVSNNIRGAAILHTIDQWCSKYIPSEDAEEFKRIAAQEVRSLHVGNIAIYQIAPDVFNKWQESEI